MGIVPATAGLATISRMIEPSKVFRLAFESTPVTHADVLAVSAAGWGGVNSHVVLTGLPENMRKVQSNGRLPPGYKSAALKAPRTAMDPKSMLLHTVITVMTQCASDALGVAIDKDTDLQGAGFDSRIFVEVTNLVAQRLCQPPIG